MLVVDDDAAVRSSLEFALGVEGYAVCTYAGAAEMLAADDLMSCDCLIVDQRLPGMSGLDLLAAARRMGVSAPAILITTHPDATLSRMALMAGATIVEKPFMENALMDRLRVVVAGQNRGGQP